jgi:hypothetical protein
MINIAIGLGAGAAAALLFASLASGSLLALILFYLAPLPILIAAIGWSHWAALIAALAASAGLAALFGTLFALAFLIGVGLPAWWLGYLALLAQDDGSGRPEGLVWYPAGNLVFWAACLGAIIVIACIPFLGLDTGTVKSTLTGSLDRALPAADANNPEAVAKRNAVIAVLVTVAPMMIALMLTLIQSVNLWLAAKVVKISGRLKRPWPALAEMRLPAATPVLLAIAMVGSLLLGLFSIPAILLASLLTAYALIGLAVVHVVTRTMGGGRRVMLTGVYGAIIVLGWPTMVMSIIGIADTLFDIRGRSLRNNGPPAKT